MSKVRVDIRSLKRSGEIFDFCQYKYSDFELTLDELEESARDACQLIGTEFVSIISIDRDF
jgi:hypothetical protein